MGTKLLMNLTKLWVTQMQMEIDLESTLSSIQTRTEKEIEWSRLVTWTTKKGDIVSIRLSGRKMNEARRNTKATESQPIPRGVRRNRSCLRE